MNWKNLINEIISTGMNQAEIARSIGVKPPTLNEHLNGNTLKDMRWQNGDKLIKLHKRVMRKAA